MRIVHWLARFSQWLSRHGRVCRRRRKLRHRFRLAISPLEPRVLLSITAVADTARIKGAGPVAFDVLANDTSTSGGLKLNSVTGVTHGTASLADTDGDGAYDRVIFTPTAGYTGAAGFSYVAKDAGNAMATATMSLTVLGTASRVTHSATGQLEAAGGLGGANYLADPRSGYTPVVSGNFSSTVTVSESSWSRNVPLGNNQHLASGPQSLMLSTRSTYTNASNWTYNETASWTYGIEVSDAVGNGYAATGGYNYTLSVTMAAGVKTTAFLYDATDHYNTATVHSLDGGRDTILAEGTDLYHLEIGNVDRPSSPDSGWQTESTQTTTVDSTAGRLSYLVEGGSVAGDLFGQGYDTARSSQSITHAQNAAGVWQAVGTSLLEGHGQRTVGWSGTGIYHIDAFVGTVTDDSARTTSNYDFSAVGTLNTDMTWSLAGAGAAVEDEQRNFACAGTAPYTLVNSGIVRTGAHNSGGSLTTTTNKRRGYTLTNGQWSEISGTDAWHGVNQIWTGYDGTGAYTRQENGIAVGGTLVESSHSVSFSDFSTLSTLGSAGWSTVGSGKSGTTVDSGLTSTGGGQYQQVQPLSEDAELSESNVATLLGNLAETARNGFGFVESNDWSLVNGAWVQTDGRRKESALSNIETDHMGAGDFDGTVQSRMTAVTEPISGSISDLSGTSWGNAGYETESRFVNGNWLQSAGSGFKSSRFRSHREAKGESPYARAGAFSSELSGKVIEESTIDSEIEYGTTSVWSTDFGWTTLGTATATTETKWKTAYSGSGAFNVPTAENPTSNSAPLTGTETESGDFSGTSTEVIVYGYQPTTPMVATVASYDPASTQPPALSVDDWAIIGGSNRSNSTGSTSSTYSGTGPNSYSGVDSQFGNWNVTGTTSIGGNTNSQSQWNLDGRWHQGRWVAVSGSATSSGGYSNSTAYAGTGTYSFLDGTTTLSGETKGAAGVAKSGSWNSTSQVNAGAPLFPTTLDTLPVWSTSGSGNGNDSSFDSVNFVTSRGTYEHGTLTDSVFQRSSSSGTFAMILPAGDDWRQTTGAAEYLNTRGVQTDLSGGGSLNDSGPMVDADGQTIGDWNFSGSFTESASTHQGSGVFSDWTWNPSSEIWMESDFGAVETAGGRNEFAWNGDGTFTSGAANGTYRNSGFGQEDTAMKVKDGEVSGLTGTAAAHASTGQNQRWSATESVSWWGLSGTYTSGAQSSSSGGWNLEWALGANDSWSLRDGDSFSAGHSQWADDFSGTSSNGSGLTQSFAFKNSASFGTSDSFEYVPATTLADGFAGSWRRSVGDRQARQSSETSYLAQLDGPYAAPFGISGTNSATEEWNWSQSQAGASRFAADENRWNKSGTGHEHSDWNYSGNFSASGATSLGTGGTYEESGFWTFYSTADVDGTWNGSAWELTGSGTDGATSFAEFDLIGNSNWSDETSLGTVAGTETSHDWAHWNYDHELKSALRLESQSGGYRWFGTEGDGEGAYEAGHTDSSDGSGDITKLFDEGVGIARGQQQHLSNSAWDESYDETYSFDTGTQTWSTSGSGTGSGDGSETARYSASGEYGNSANGAKLTLSGDATDDWTADWTWDNTGNWTFAISERGMSRDDSNYHAGHSASVSSSPIENYTTGTITMETVGSRDRIEHAEGESASQATWAGNSGGFVWQSSAQSLDKGTTRDMSQSEATRSWDTTYDDGITQRHNVGHETDGVLDQDIETWFESSLSTSASDGSSSVILETGGEKDMTHGLWHNNRNDWTETRRTGPASAPGGTTGSFGSPIGFGPTQTTSGTTSSQWSNETANHSEWNETQSFTTPAVFGGGIVFGGSQSTSFTVSGQSGSPAEVEDGDTDASGDSSGDDSGTSAQSLNDGDSSDSDWTSDGSREGWDPGVFAYFAPGTSLGGGGLSPIDEPPSAGDDIPADNGDGLPTGGVGGPLPPPEDVSEPVVLRISQGSQFIGRLPDGTPIPLLEGDQDARNRQLAKLLRDNDATASQTEALVSLFSGLDVNDQSRLMAQLQRSANRQNQAIPVRATTPDEVLRREQEQQHLQKLDLKTKRYEYLGDNRFRAAGSRVILVVDPITDRILAHDDSDAQRGRITPLQELPPESSYFRPPKEPSSFAGAREWQDYQDELNRETWRAGNAFNLRIDAVFGILGAGVALGKLRTILTPSEQAEFNRLRTLHPEWMPQAGLDSIVEVRTIEENRDARNKVRGNGHHPHPLKFGGDPNPQQLVVTGETQTQKNPIHREVSNFWNSLLSRLRSEGVAK